MRYRPAWAMYRPPPLPHTPSKQDWFSCIQSSTEKPENTRAAIRLPETSLHKQLFQHEDRVNFSFLKSHFTLCYVCLGVPRPQSVCEGWRTTCRSQSSPAIKLLPASTPRLPGFPTSSSPTGPPLPLSPHCF